MLRDIVNVLLVDDLQENLIALARPDFVLPLAGLRRLLHTVVRP